MQEEEGGTGGEGVQGAAARGWGRRAAPRQQSHGAGGWVRATAPKHRRAPPPAAPRVPPSLPPPLGHDGGTSALWGCELPRGVPRGAAAPLTGGGGAAGPSPPSRWVLPPRRRVPPALAPSPAATHRLAHPAGRDARPGERGVEV